MSSVRKQLSRVVGNCWPGVQSPTDHPAVIIVQNRHRTTHTGTPFIVLIQNLNIRIIHAATGDILRQLTLNPNTTYQPTS